MGNIFFKSNIFFEGGGCGGGKKTNEKKYQINKHCICQHYILTQSMYKGNRKKSLSLRYEK